MQEMKKTFLFVTVTVLILNATGCGVCRNGLFARRTMATPVVGQVQHCMPACQPVCCPPPCDPCCTSTPVSVGYEGGAMMVPDMDGGCVCGP